MSKCYFCERDIDRVIRMSTFTEEIFLDKKGKVVHGDYNYPYADDYICPLCKRPLFATEEEVIKFLKGESNENPEE